MRIFALIALFASLSLASQGGEAAELPKAVEVAVPGYPRLLSGEREEGEIYVDLEIGKDGKVLDARAVTGPESYRLWAEAAARKWRFEPPQAGQAKARLVFAFILVSVLKDPLEVTSMFKPPNRVEVFAPRWDVVTIADPPIEDVVKEQQRKRLSKKNEK